MSKSDLRNFRTCNQLCICLNFVKLLSRLFGLNEKSEMIKKINYCWVRSRKKHFEGVRVKEKVLKGGECGESF